MSVLGEEFDKKIEKLLMRGAINNIPHAKIEEHLFDLFEENNARLLVMALLNDFRFIEKVLQDEFGEEKAAEIFKKVKESKVLGADVPGDSVISI